MLKGKGFEDGHREEIHDGLSKLIPARKIIPLTPAVLSKGVYLQSKLDYFDSLIAATAMEEKAVEVITTDRSFPLVGLRTTW